MRSYSPEFVQVMRAALDQVMTQIPLERATPSIKAHMAEIILKAAAAGESTYKLTWFFPCWPERYRQGRGVIGASHQR